MNEVAQQIALYLQDSNKWYRAGGLSWDLSCSTSLLVTWKRQQSALVNSAGDTELGGPADTAEGSAAFWRDLS